MKRYLCSLFTDKGGKLLLTRVVSPRYSVQNDRVLSFLFEPCEYFRIVGQMDWERQPVIREGLPSRSDDKARPKSMFQSQTSTQKYLAESEFYPPTLTISYWLHSLDSLIWAHSSHNLDKRIN